MSATSSSNRLTSLLGLVPGAYFFMTRVRGAQDFIYLVASSYIPAWWMLIRLGGQGPLQAAANFALGYLAFIAVYELGYLANDLFDARRPGGRKRWRGADGPAFVAAFVLCRLAIWFALGWLTNWLNEPIWLAAFACLAIAFTLHNVIGPPAPRSATFAQLGLLRFIMPIVGALSGAQLILAMLIAVFLYVYLRWLAYLDSKDLLNIPGRRNARFALVQMVLLLPIILLISVTASTSLPLEIWAFLVILYGARHALMRGRSVASG